MIAVSTPTPFIAATISSPVAEASHQILSWGRHPNRLQARMCTGRARFHSIEIRAYVVPRQVQHLASELPIFLDLRLGLRRSASEFAVRIAWRRDPTHRRFEFRVL